MTTFMLKIHYESCPSILHGVLMQNIYLYGGLYIPWVIRPRDELSKLPSVMLLMELNDNFCVQCSFWRPPNNHILSLNAEHIFIWGLIHHLGNKIQRRIIRVVKCNAVDGVK
jgi:hypothetical protein